MYKFFLWYSGCFFSLFISVLMHGQNDTRKNKDIPDTLLPDQSLILKEVVVRASPKIIVNKDTVTYRVDAFTDNSEKVVEDLLKKLPGIEVAKDGSIYVHGKKVERVLVDGDDLFKKNYVILSRNLSAGLIDKVQVIESYPENSLLKGLVNSDGKTINITLKNRRKKVLFGNVSAGIGTTYMQDASCNLVAFSGKTKIYFLANYTTTGRDPMPGISGQTGFSGQDNMAENTVNKNLVDIYGLYGGDIDQEKIHFNKAKLLSGSFVHRPSPNLTIRFSGWFFSDNTTRKQANTYSYYTDQATIAINENISCYKKPAVKAAAIDISYLPGKKSSLRFSSELKNTQMYTTADLLADSGLVYNNLYDNKWRYESALDYTKRINDHKALTLKAAYVHEIAKQYFICKAYPVRGLPFTNLFPSLLYQSVYYPLGMTSFSSNYIAAKNSWRLNIDISTTLRSQCLRSVVDTNNSIKSPVSISDSYFNNERLRRLASHIGLTLSKKIHSLQLTASASGNYIQENFLSATKQKEQFNNLVYVATGIQIRWQRKNHTASVSYSCDARLPEMSDLYGNYIITGYRSLAKGSYFFTSRPVYSGYLEYTYTKLSRQLIAYITISGTHTNAMSQSNLYLSEYYDIMQNSSFGTGSFYYLFAGIDKFVNSISAGIKLKTVISANQYQNTVNNSANRKVTSFASITQMSFRSAFKGLFNYNTGIIVNYSKSSIVSSQEALLQNHTITNFLDLYFRFSDRIQATINNERYYFYAVKTSKKSYYSIDLSIKYELVKNKISCALTGKNLSGNTIYRSTQITDYYSKVQQYALVPLYILLQLTCRF